MWTERQRTRNQWRLAAEVRNEPEKKREANAKEKAGDDREIKSCVLAAMDDVAGKMAEAEWKFSAEEEKSADEQKKAAKENQGAAEFTERIHVRILDEMK
jgi:hypothetical protein